MPVDKSGSRIRQMFGEIAERYDFMNHFLSAGTDVYWRWQSVRMAAPFNDAPILDVCTGTGDLAFAFRKKLNGAATVYATDFTHGMLKLAEQKKCDRDVVFLEADTLSLPFPSDKFQVVSVAFGLRNVSSTIGGLLSHTYQWYFRNILPRLGQLLVRNRQAAYEYLPQSVSEFPSGLELTGIMEEAGLVNTSFRKMTGGIATVYLGTKPEHP